MVASPLATHYYQNYPPVSLPIRISSRHESLLPIIVLHDTAFHHGTTTLYAGREQEEVEQDDGEDLFDDVGTIHCWRAKENTPALIHSS